LAAFLVCRGAEVLLFGCNHHYPSTAAHVCFMCQADPAPSLLDMAFALLAVVANWRVTQLSSSLPFVMCPSFARLERGGLNNTEDPGVLCVCLLCFLCCIVPFADKVIPNVQSRSLTWDCPAIGSVSIASSFHNCAILEEHKVRECPDMKCTLTEVVATVEGALLCPRQIQRPPHLKAKCLPHSCCDQSR